MYRKSDSDEMGSTRVFGEPEGFQKHLEDVMGLFPLKKV
jgi:hypothetical protein